MSLKGFVFVLLIAIGFSVSSQEASISSVPESPTISEKVTITFDSSKEGRLGFYTGDLFAHTGVIVEGNGSWQHVIGNWGDNAVQPKLTHKGDGIYELEISPDIISFYNVSQNEIVVKLAFVFRSADGSKQTNDLFIDVNSLYINITRPVNKSFFDLNQTISIEAKASQEASLKLFVGENKITESNDTAIKTDYTFTQGGKFWVIAEASTEGENVRDSIYVFVSDGVVTSPKPSNYKKGINYINNNNVALVLWAPLKDSVYVVGDFNDWKTTEEYKMNKDGYYFWLEISNLEPGKEYAFQYLIDGKIKIADPYAEKILNPWDDRYIPNDVYPDLKPYPDGKTYGIASVFQTAQEEYNWEVTDFQIPDKNKLVIYELLVRDFMEEHTYKAVREKMDYLEDLRINVLELMPVNEFEGNISWGYNTAFYFAPDKYYGPKNELKKLIDECHKRGIAVVIDMVLNHSYGQSPFVQMYMNNWTVLPENPWYNVSSPNPVYYWGYDFDHEATAVKELVDSVNSFWMNEYKVDGFRFDFTKGFTNTPGDGWGYDASRIQILKRMSDEIWKRKEDALVILEHLADNKEETELANHGILLWGNMHGDYERAAKGEAGISDLKWALYNERGWNEPNLVSYPESHDEERIMYTLKQSGLSLGDYNIRNQSTALDRMELNSLFYLPLPGPKMIWQFGERGYDLSINRCPDGSVNNGCRTDPKPSYWQYLDNSDRTDLFQVMAKLNELKQTYEEFTPESFSYDLAGYEKWYSLTANENHVFAIGNFDIKLRTANVVIPKTGKWYEFFTRDSIEFNNVQQSISLAPGEYRLYSTREFEDPRVSTDIVEAAFQQEQILLYPNPADKVIHLTGRSPISKINAYSMSGKLIYQSDKMDSYNPNLQVESWLPGVYLIQVFQQDKISTLKFVKQ